MAPGAALHIASDHKDYFDGIRSLLRTDRRFTEIEPFQPSEEERTEFERIFVASNEPIGRCSFRTASA
jgi:tRNA G46 methylase TrmB